MLSSDIPSPTSMNVKCSPITLYVESLGHRCVLRPHAMVSDLECSAIRSWLVGLRRVEIDATCAAGLASGVEDFATWDRRVARILPREPGE